MQTLQSILWHPWKGLKPSHSTLIENHWSKIFLYHHLCYTWMQSFFPHPKTVTLAKLCLQEISNKKNCTIVKWNLIPCCIIPVIASVVQKNWSVELSLVFTDAFFIYPAFGVVHMPQGVSIAWVSEVLLLWSDVAWNSAEGNKDNLKKPIGGFKIN